MNDILTALGEQHAELAGLVDGLDDDGWGRPSACEGWAVSDVLLHLAQTDEMAVASLRGTYAEKAAALAEGITAADMADVDGGVEFMVQKERGAPGEAVFKRWATGAEELCRLLSEADPKTRVIWVAGELSVHTLATTRLAETWIHTWDVATGLGAAVEVSDRLRHIARLAWRTVPYAFGRADVELSGPVAFRLTGAGGAAWDFEPDEPAATVVRGDALDLCLVAGQRKRAEETSLTAEGPDAGNVLRLVRTYA